MSSALFTRLQAASFYARLHAEAVELVRPATAGERWIDVGCGPGLVTRLAAERGYDALGIDRSEAMIRAARRVASEAHSPARFSCTDLESLREAGETFDVVSAASLLAVLPDPRRGLEALWALVRPGGRLLVIEPTSCMRPSSALRVLARMPHGERHPGLLLWSWARAGRSVERDVEAFAPSDLGGRERRALLGGLVAAVCLQRTSEGETQ